MASLRVIARNFTEKVLKMNQWALVTGATAGIGESFTRLLASQRYNIVLVARDENRLLERAFHLREKYGVETRVIRADLSTADGMTEVETFLHENKVDVLINNAGFGLNKAFTHSDIHDETAMLDVLVKAPMRFTHIVLPQMKARNSGTVINVSSVAGFIAGGTYSASKSYLTVFSESLHTELRGTKVHVTALCPGFTRTEFHERGKMKMTGLPNFAWLSADQVVADAWRDSQDGCAVSVPGRLYKALLVLIRILPRSIVRRVGMGIRKKQR
jgi:short-subunit dehydrogenase